MKEREWKNVFFQLFILFGGEEKGRRDKYFAFLRYFEILVSHLLDGRTETQKRTKMSLNLRGEKEVWFFKSISRNAYLPSLFISSFFSYFEKQKVMTCVGKWEKLFPSLIFFFSLFLLCQTHTCVSNSVTRLTIKYI